MFSMVSFAQENQSAQELLNSALEMAKKENINVFVKYKASWCAWCKKMDNLMHDENIEPYFNENYVIISIDVSETGKNKKLETPGGEALLAEQGGTDKGLPYWVILDSDGKILNNSLDAEGNNVGCPSTESEVDLFSGILASTSKLTESQINQIAMAFKKK